MEHKHTHTHGDGHTHSHEHTHTHSHTEDNSDEIRKREETKALLAYMIDHNVHHAEELADLLDSLPTAAQKKLRRAIGTFEVANIELQEVLNCLE